MALDASLVRSVREWIAADPDPLTRAEAQSLLDAHDSVGLVDRFGASLRFGTAGLRGALGAGPNRMNRLVVRRAAGGLADYLVRTDASCRTRGVVIAHDARHGSAEFAMDSARVFAARGIRARLLPALVPTPVLAWSVTELGASAGVMVTASHNPPQDNGYKVYLADGAQIVAPHDSNIAEHIEAVGLDVALAPDDRVLVERVDTSIIDRYADFAAAVRLVPSVGGVPVAATALHGVGGGLLAAVFERAGFAAPITVSEQQVPDADFPTVPFPNPEEPGAMDRVIALARASGAALALANDPDADRLGVAIPDRAGSTTEADRAAVAWRRLTGDEIGWLLADHILRHTSGSDRLVVTTLVSSSMLARLAAAHGVHHIETFTGFKWIARAMLDHPELRFVFGYEQALGYLVAQRPLDKDGISAAVLMAEVAACAAAEGSTIEERLRVIRSTFGDLRTAERSIRMSPAESARRVASLAQHPPREVGGYAVTAVEHVVAADLLRLWCGGARLQVRPSGTETKVKLYVESEGVDPTLLLDGLDAVVSGTST